MLLNPLITGVHTLTRMWLHACTHTPLTHAHEPGRGAPKFFKNEINCPPPLSFSEYPLASYVHVCIRKSVYPEALHGTNNWFTTDQRSTHNKLKHVDSQAKVISPDEIIMQFLFLHGPPAFLPSPKYPKSKLVIRERDFTREEGSW